MPIDVQRKPSSREGTLKEGSLKSPGSSMSRSFKNKSTLVRRLSKRIRRVVDKPLDDNIHSDDALISKVAGLNSPSKPVTKSTSLNRDKNGVTTQLPGIRGTTRRRRVGSHTISKCSFDLKDFEEYSREDIPKLVTHFENCEDPAHILPQRLQSHIAFSSKPPFLKVKTAEIPDTEYVEEHKNDPEIQKIIDLIVKRAEDLNAAAASGDNEAREMLLETESSMRWYLVHRTWESVKRSSRMIDWGRLLGMLIP